MAETDPISVYYADNPVEVLDKNQRVWYDPDILMLWKNRALFADTIAYKKNLGDIRATSMIVNQLLEPHADYTALATRQLWLPAMHIDSRQVEITFSHHGGKVAMHTYDDLVTYWKFNGQAGLRAILNTTLGQHIIDVHDMLARNAYLYGALAQTGYVLYPQGVEDFGDLLATHVFDPDYAAEVQLGMKYREVAGALSPDGSAGSVICYTTPGVIYDIQGDENWIDKEKYGRPESLFKYEVGSYKNVRFIESPRLTLWNCGALDFQETITKAILAGDGAPDPASAKVDGTYMVGQSSAGITNYIQLSGTPETGDLSAIQVNDIVTIHLTRTSSFGVTNGVNPFEGTLHNRRVVSIDTEHQRLTLDKPIMIDMNTDLGDGVYAYLSFGLGIHSSIFVGGPQAIVAGLAAPIRMHTPPPIDDLEAIYRFSWDDRMGYQPFAPEVAEVVFTAGTTRYKGRRLAS
jgi:hypothetical protein